MWTQVTLNDGSTYPYGFGWRLAKTIHGMRVVQHSGTWQGFKSYIIRVLDARVTVVIFANLDDVDAGDLARRVLELCNPQFALQSDDDDDDKEEEDDEDS